jgi:hypothetical protein
VDASYNRFAWNDPQDLPDWFVDDEHKHYRPQVGRGWARRVGVYDAFVWTCVWVCVVCGCGGGPVRAAWPAVCCGRNARVCVRVSYRSRSPRPSWTRCASDSRPWPPSPSQRSDASRHVMTPLPCAVCVVGSTFLMPCSPPPPYAVPCHSGPCAPLMLTSACVCMCMCRCVCY